MHVAWVWNNEMMGCVKDEVIRLKANRNKSNIRELCRREMNLRKFTDLKW
jgi:hypothetical protein